MLIIPLNTLSVASVFSTVIPYVIAVLLFLLMVVIHEFGHFIFAKIFGVKVNEFSVGFGPTILKWHGKETEYSIRLIPFGGYCAMEGEDEASTDSKAFCNKHPAKRFVIVAAGAIFNIIFGFLLMFILFLPAKGIVTTTVSDFDTNATSIKSGLNVGDEILKIDGRSCGTSTEIDYAFTAVKNNKVDILVLRNNKKQLIKNVNFKMQKFDGVNVLIRDFNLKFERNNLFVSLKQSFKFTVSYARIVLYSLYDLISGRYSLNAVSGPIGVASALGEVTKFGIDALIPVLALITVNLGVFNLLPVPALDGGRLLFILFELIFKKPVPAKKEALVHGIGFAVLMVFIALITLKDIIGLF